MDATPPSHASQSTAQNTAAQVAFNPPFKVH